jgi:hypothetical protein
MNNRHKNPKTYYQFWRAGSKLYNTNTDWKHRLNKWNLRTKSKGQRCAHAKQAQREGSGRALPLLNLGATQGVWSTPCTVHFTLGTVCTGGRTGLGTGPVGSGQVPPPLVFDSLHIRGWIRLLTVKRKCIHKIFLEMWFTHRTHNSSVTLLLIHKTHYSTTFWSLQFTTHFPDIQLDISLCIPRGEFPLDI